MQESIWNRTASLRPREPLSGDRQADAAVIGGGLAGILTAHFLRAAGLETVVLEAARAEKKIGKALEAHVVLYPQGDEGKRAMEKLSAFTTDQLADLFIVSDVEIAQGAGAAGVKVPGIQAAVSEAKGEKCERCWKHHIKVGADKEHPTLCPRCAKVIRTIEL